MSYAPIPAGVEDVATQVIGAAIAVHRELGPGVLERIYQEPFAWSFTPEAFPSLTLLLRNGTP